MTILQTFLADYGMIWVGEKSDDPFLDSEDDSEEEEVNSLTRGEVQKMWKPGLL